MNLQKQLDNYKKGFVANAPKAALETMHNATAALAASGLVEKALGVGDRAPDFSLSNSTGQTVSLNDLIKNGPLVLTFYRGKW